MNQLSRRLYIGKHGRPEYGGERGGRHRTLCRKRSAVRLCKRCELTTSRKRAAKDMAAREEENAARLALSELLYIPSCCRHAVVPLVYRTRIQLAAEQRKRNAEEARRTAEQTKRRSVMQQEIAAEEKDMAARKKCTTESGGQHAATPATSATVMVGAYLPISRQKNKDSLNGRAQHKAPLQVW